MRLLDRLQIRLTVLYAALFGAVMVASCALTWASVTAQARRTVETNLVASGGVFDRLWQDRADRIRSGAEVLAKDFGFRAALASRDGPTIASAVDNLRARLHLDVAFALDADGRPLSAGAPPIARTLGATLVRTGEAQGVVSTQRGPVEVVSAPVYAPQLQGWLVFGVRLDAAQMRSLTKLSAIPLSADVISGDHGVWRSAASHLVAAQGGPSLGYLQGAQGRELALIRPLATPKGFDQAALLLHFSEAEAMAPYRALLWTLSLVAVFGMMLVVWGSWALARSITRPIAGLAQAASRIRDGEVVHVPVAGGGEVGALAGGFNAMVDAVTEREAQIRHFALTDGETGLANRRAFEEVILEMEASGGEGRLVVAAFGVHQFARMRGVLGYELAAELLASLGKRLAALQPTWSLARTASDTLSVGFRAMMGGVALSEVEAVRRVLEAAVPAGEHLIDVRIATGLSAGLASHLIRDAELALDAARQQGLPSARFDPAARGRAAESLGLMPELRRAIAADALSLAHQPKWDVRQGVVTGVESLVRWTHPVRGPIRPDAFIGPAEDTGDIRALTDWVVMRALQEQADLARAGRRLCFSLNLSGRLVGDAAYTRWLLETLSRAVGKICLEITETAVIGNPEAAMATFRAFSEAGVGVSIDDYGSGLSSLAYLKQIAADELKLDRSLVCDVARSSRDALLIRSTVDLAHGLGMKVVAEGVEDDISMGLLASLGCDLIQGYHVAKPMPLKDLSRFLANAPIGGFVRPPVANSTHG